MRRPLRWVLLWSAAWLTADAITRRWFYKRTPYYRWRLGWGGRLGPWCWRLSPSDLPRIEWRWDSDGGHAFYGIEFAVDGCDPIASLIWEPASTRSTDR